MNHISAGFHSPTATTISTSTHTTVLTHSPGHLKQHLHQPIQQQYQYRQEPQNQLETELHSSPMSNGSINGHSIESSPDISNGCSLNYSPKHSRKVSSLSNRNINMKNLSLNLGENGTAAQQLLQQQSHQQNQPVAPAGSSNPPRLARVKTLTLSIPADHSIEPPLVTPVVTKTPQIPPLIPRPQRSHTTDGVLLTSSHIPSGSSEDSPFAIPRASFHDRNPFREHNNSTSAHISSSPAAANLQSPFLMNSSVLENQFTTEFSGLQISSKPSKEPPITASKPINGSTSFGNTPNKNYVLKIPEELQESSTLIAYPNGPANVLNGSIFLFSDPDPTLESCLAGNIIDINDYDLVINVAKECKDMSSQLDTTMGTKEYIHVTWSHTSSILKELPNLVSKIAKYEDSELRGPNQKKRKILIHCQCGVSRSACVVVGYFMYKFNIGVNEAYELLKSGTKLSQEPFNIGIGARGYDIDACDRICPNMSLIFELMEFGDSLKNGSDVREG